MLEEIKGYVEEYINILENAGTYVVSLDQHAGLHTTVILTAAAAFMQ